MPISKLTEVTHDLLDADPRSHVLKHIMDSRFMPPTVVTLARLFRHGILRPKENDMSDMTAIAESLGAKLESLDLNDEERNVLTALLSPSAAPEVEGHGWDEGVAAMKLHGVTIQVQPWMSTGYAVAAEQDGLVLNGLGIQHSE